MTDDFARLRGAMSDLAEEGGSPDMYDRTIAASRRLRRRRLATAGAAAAVAAIGVTVPLTVGGPAPSGPSAAYPSEGATGTPLPAPISKPVEDGCPVSAATLLRAKGMPPGARITPDTVRCQAGWASGFDLDRPEDGRYLFRYTVGDGWQKTAKGTGVDCMRNDLPPLLCD
jgi:hypothetical protein